MVKRTKNKNPEKQTDKAYCISVNETISKIRGHINEIRNSFNDLPNTVSLLDINEQEFQEKIAQLKNKRTSLKEDYAALKRFKSDAEKVGCSIYKL